MVRSSTTTASPLGFPVAEVAADGSSVITKHAGTGGVGHPRHGDRAADVRDAVDAATSAPTSPPTSTPSSSATTDRTGCESPASAARRRRQQLKVCVNELGGFRNSVEFVLTGLDVEAKAAWVRAQLDAAARPLRRSPGRSARCPPPTPTPRRAPRRLLRCTVQDPAPDPVGRAFTGAAVELALASYPGFTMTAPPGNGTPYGVYRAEYVDRSRTPCTPTAPRCTDADGPRPEARSGDRGRPLGTFVHARSGDKGGDANLGLWVAHDGSTRGTTRGWRGCSPR